MSVPSGIAAVLGVKPLNVAIQCAAMGFLRKLGVGGRDTPHPLSAGATNLVCPICKSESFREPNRDHVVSGYRTTMHASPVTCVNCGFIMLFAKRPGAAAH